ncbi:MAG: SDR family oxidoreductase [Saprospiraceae bacterium]|nr:SDR family oxidoreductase [Saprospiraceae bacterium]
MKADSLLSPPFANDALRGRTAVVCGSTQGIGFAAAEVLAGMGARVILVARNEEKLKECVAALPQTHLNHSYLVADFTIEAEVDALAEKLSSLEVSILVNNTGGPAGGKIMEAQPQAFLQAFQAHLLANHKLTTAVLPSMKNQAYGRIINVISTSVKQPLPNLGVSNTIRGAVANWAKTMANEVAPFGITVNNVLPGATATGRLENIIANKAQNTGKESSDVAAEMTREIPAGRFGEAIEIAYAIGFLASPYAAYVNGINLPVDGGRTASL